MGGPNSGAKNRKPGEWMIVEKGRRGKQRDTSKSHGLTNIPKVGEVGSAAYRRLVNAANRVTRNSGR